MERFLEFEIGYQVIITAGQLGFYPAIATYLAISVGTALNMNKHKT